MDKKIGAQYFTIRDFTKTIEDFDMACKKIKDIGYKIVQISGTPLPAKPMREVLDKYGLKAVTSHRSFDDFKTNLDEIIDYNKTLGCDLCGIGMMPKEYFESKESVREFIKEAGKVCEVLKKENMYFGYHNHAAEFMKHDSKYVFDYLVEETDPEMFNFIVDTYWCHVAGLDAAEIIEKLGKRAMALHFKDLTVNAEVWKYPIMAEVGNGNLDWDKIIAAGEKAGSRWAIVEQDVCPADPFDSLKMSYDFLTTKDFI